MSRTAGLRLKVSNYVVVVLALVLVGGAHTLVFAPKSKADTAGSQSIAVENGRQLYLQGCSTCHGLDNTGGAGGPSLIGVGQASVVYQVGSGRMPLANGAAQAERKKVKYDTDQIDALSAYIQSKGGGPQVPASNLSDGDLALGGDLFRTNCSSCHNFSGEGGALTRDKVAPPLEEANARVIWGAMLSGPESMPRFDAALTPAEKQDITTYVQYITHSKNQGGAGLGRLGPVSEGLVIFVVGMGLLIVVTLWIGARA